MGDRVILFETMIFMQRVNGVKERPGLCINVTIEFKVLEPHTALYKMQWLREYTLTSCIFTLNLIHVQHVFIMIIQSMTFRTMASGSGSRGPYLILATRGLRQELEAHTGYRANSRSV